MCCVVRRRMQTQSSRMMNARSRVPRLIIEGMDLDEVTLRMEKVGGGACSTACA
jgi:hypothetical protein